MALNDTITALGNSIINLVNTKVNTKQDVLTAGDNITIENNTISAKSGGGALPIGSEIMVPATSDYVPEGCLLKDGSEYTKEQFPELWENYLKGQNIRDIDFREIVTNLSKTNEHSAAYLKYINNMYILLPHIDASGRGNLYFSSDLNKWESSTNFMVDCAGIIDMIYGNGLYVVLYNTQNNEYAVKTSTDLKNWSSKVILNTSKSSNYSYGDNIIFDGYKFILVTYYGELFSSTDCLTWSKIYNFDQYDCKIKYVNNVYFVYTDSRVIFSSLDCSNWSNYSFSSIYYSVPIGIYYVKNIGYMYVEDEYDNNFIDRGIILLSTDGLNWEQHTYPDIEFKKVVVDTTGFYILTNIGVYIYDGVELIKLFSTDGIYVGELFAKIDELFVVGNYDSRGITINTIKKGGTWSTHNFIPSISIKNTTSDVLNVGDNILINIYNSFNHDIAASNALFAISDILYSGKLSPLSYTDYATQVEKFGVCESFAIDTANGKFKVPYKVSPKRFLVKSYTSGTSWYNIYSDGWCEQGGKIERSAATQSISLIKTYKNTNYSIFMQPYHTAAGSDGRPTLSYEATSSSGKTTSAFIYNSYTKYAGCYWRTCGYISNVSPKIDKYYVYVGNAQN